MIKLVLKFILSQKLNFGESSSDFLGYRPVCLKLIDIEIRIHFYIQKIGITFFFSK